MSATIHKIVSPATLSNILLHMVLFTVFVAIFFFTYGARVEQNVVKQQTTLIVDDLSRDFKNVLPPAQLAQLRPLLDQYLQVPDMSQADQTVADHNKALLHSTLKLLGVVGGVGLVLSGAIYFGARVYQGGKYAFSGWEMVRNNLVILVLDAVVEFCFLTFLAQNFRSADPNTVKLAIVNTLQSYATGTKPHVEKAKITPAWQ